MKMFWDKYWALIILGAILMMFLLGSIIDKNGKRQTVKNSKYTVAYITSNWHHKNNNGVGTDFKYYVNGRTISKTCNYNLQKGTKYLVMYDSINPSWYIMLGHHQLPDHIEVPSNGWKFNEIPISIDSADLKQYFKKLGID